jgi:hypothetical protein
MSLTRSNDPLVWIDCEVCERVYFVEEVVDVWRLFLGWSFVFRVFLGCDYDK